MYARLHSYPKSNCPHESRHRGTVDLGVFFRCRNGLDGKNMLVTRPSYRLVNESSPLISRPSRGSKSA